jgi:hypothetical protein
VNGEPLQAGDALKTDASLVDIDQARGAEILVFDLPAKP